MTINIRVPGSTSNLGPGFDSIGVALNLYLELSLSPSDSWEFVALSSDLEGELDSSDNLIMRTAKHVGQLYNQEEDQAYRVEVKNDIPLARGLGSSAAAIVAGIELANYAYDLKLPTEEKVNLATNFEGHPDNVVPSIVGGCVIAHYEEDGVVNWQKLSVDKPSFVALIPKQELKTSEAREVLPSELPYKQAVEASSVANVLVVALAQENWQLAGKMMEKDLFHHQYRKELIPQFEDIQAFMRNEGAYGTFLSGAGPTIMSLMDTDLVKRIEFKWVKNFHDFEWRPLNVDTYGLDINRRFETNPIK
ncbi:homoserine kinase [Pontibacillus yanchengensis]|uniref:Homoserine kinase n=1 Tax=Pontibacillus yanchengensis Y32 TaxID=1385514 RepID=A0A0A2T9R8_9BACI|nr:homoserine kinase [Pontibacillus yanchengensis]KGP71158.1 serine kinase [Pontibacillus yanchengensis Y32]